MDQPHTSQGWWPADEHARLGVLERVMAENAPLRHAVDLISEGVAAALDVPAALVSLIGRDRQFFLGHSAGQRDTIPVELTFCQHVVALKDKLIVEETEGHPVVGGNPSIEEFNVHSYAGQPIVVQGQTLGSLCAFDNVPRQWTEREISALRSFADAVQYMIEARVITEARQGGAEVHAREQAARLSVYEALAGDSNSEALGRRLQHALIPAPAAAPGLSVDVFYQAGSDRLLLGSDFVDTLPGEDGVLHFAIGDVSGNGPEAAALAIGLRSSWHALQSVDTELAQTVRVLDRQAADADLYATVLIGSITAAGHLSLVNAGHPDPLMVGATVMELATEPGPMLGLGNAGSRWLRSDHEVPAQTFVAYTDGLVEGTIHRSAERFGVERLVATIRQQGADPAGLCQAASDANGAPLSDDVAILRIAPGA